MERILIVMKTSLTILMIKTEYADNMLTIGALNFDYGDKVVAGFSNWESERWCLPGVKFMQQHQMTLSNTWELQWLLKCCWSCCYNSFLLSKLTIASKTHFDGFRCSNYWKCRGGRKSKTAVLLLLCQEKIVNAYNALLMADKMSRK
jgi:hypothetical protein